MQTKIEPEFNGSVAPSISNAKGYGPFYDAYCREISSHLLSLIEIGSAVSDSLLSSTCLNRMVENSWFSTEQKFHANGNSGKICCQSSMFFPAIPVASAGTRIKSRKLRIYPTQQQQHLFRQWFGVARKFYNAAVEFYNSKDKDTVNWMEIAKRLTRTMPDDYIKGVPYQIKKIAVKDCYQAFMNGVHKYKKSKQVFSLSFKSRKNPKQSCYIPKSAVTQQGIYRTISGVLKISERALLASNTFKDCRLVCESDRWYIIIPMTIDNQIMVSENQGNGDMVAIDPGVRTFVTYFSKDGHFGSFGYDAFHRVLRLQFKIDRLLSKVALEKNKKKQRNLKRSVSKVRWHIHDLVDELHNKVALYFATNYKVVFLPTYETSDMVKKGRRKINKTVVRAMLSFRYYDFGQKLERLCREHGGVCIRCNEAYTSKTNSFNGDVMPALGGKRKFIYNGVEVDRDLNGARNILLRAMRDSSAHGCDSRGMLSNKVAVFNKDGKIC